MLRGWDRRKKQAQKDITSFLTQAVNPEIDTSGIFLSVSGSFMSG
jgi:hypothetical protein